MYTVCNKMQGSFSKRIEDMVDFQTISDGEVSQQAAEPTKLLLQDELWMTDGSKHEIRGLVLHCS